MPVANWGNIANSGFDAYGNFQGGWEVGSSSSCGYEKFTNLLNFAGQVAPTLGLAGAAFGIGLNQAAAMNNTFSVIDKLNSGNLEPSDAVSGAAKAITRKIAPRLIACGACGSSAKDRFEAKNQVCGRRGLTRVASSVDQRIDSAAKAFLGNERPDPRLFVSIIGVL